jgi:hypothetical protein
MITVDLAVKSLYTIIDKEPYRTSQSWVRTQDYTSNTLLQHSRKLEPFVLDERFVTLAEPKHISK